MESVYKTEFENIKLKNRGKVRDIYELDDFLLFVASDRISAFDVVMNEAVPGKGKILSGISKFWFEKTSHIIKNHLITGDADQYPDELKKYKNELEGRSMLVHKCEPLPVEFIVRGYLAGSGWKSYKKDRTVTGIKLPEGLEEFQKFPEPLFTPSTKAEVGHDENISYEQSKEILGDTLASELRDISLRLYQFGYEHMEKRGIILADTKFEFGRLPDGQIILIDEVLTPDSSRFWLKENYAPGKPQVQFDKQVLRDYLEQTGWDKEPPPPELPGNVIQDIIEGYNEAYRRITE